MKKSKIEWTEETDEWFKSFEMRDELFLDEFILMPNHLHAIVGLETGGMETDGALETVGMETDGALETVGMETVGTHGPNPVGTHGRASLQGTSQPFQRKPKSISSFVAGYKSVVLNKIDDYIDERQLPLQKFNRRNPLWQANYYDHIIRDVESFARITEYIRRNPEKWK